jgi:hypothetical protein
LGAKILKIKEIAEELPRAFSDYDCVGLSNALQACSKVRGLTYNTALLRLARSDQIADYDQPCSDADTSLKWAGCLQGTDPCDQL